MRCFSAAFFFLLAVCVGLALGSTPKRLLEGVWFDEEDKAVEVSWKNNSAVAGRIDSRMYKHLAWYGKVFYEPRLTGAWDSWWAVNIYIYDMDANIVRARKTYQLNWIKWPPSEYSIECQEEMEVTNYSYLGLFADMNLKRQSSFNNATYEYCDWITHDGYHWTEKHMGHYDITLYLIHVDKNCHW